MRLGVALSTIAVLLTATSARNLDKRQWGWPNFGGGNGGNGGKTINDYKREQVAGRDIHVYAPSNLAPNSPLLLSLHGMDQDPNYQQSNTHWETLADSEGFVVVYPRGGTGMSTWDIQGTKDTQWVSQIIDQMKKEYNIDTKRVYLSGFSMGGMFTYHAMSQIANKIAAFAPCSGPNVFGASKAQRPVPIFHVHGTNDDVLNYQQVEGFLKNYRDQFHCPSQADTKTNYPNRENPNATLYTWGPCDKGVYIKHLKLQGRGHSPSSADIQDIWDFVSQWTVDGPVSASGNGGGNTTPTNPTPTNPSTGGNGNGNGGSTDKCSSNITKQGYKCCASNCEVVYTDSDGDWGVENDQWCGCGNRVTVGSGTCSAKILQQGYKCCPSGCIIYYTDEDGTWGVNGEEWCGCGSGSSSTGGGNDAPSSGSGYQGANGTNFCNNAKHSGESVKVTSNKVGDINGIGYELWADSGNNSATFYYDCSFSCSFQRAKDYLCRSGLSFDSTKTHKQIGHIYAEFKLVKQNIQNVDYSYVGIYGWTRNPLVEFYVVDNWLSQWRPGDWVGNKKHGDFTIDGAQYTVYENTRYGPSIDGDTNFKQYFSIRQQPRDCGTIDITAHFEQWEKLGMTMGKMHEAKVLGEAGSNNGGTSGTADFPFAKVYVKN